MKQLLRLFVVLCWCAGWVFAQNPADANGSITGSITLQGKPAPQVLVLAVENTFNNPQVLARTLTDEAGQYRLNNLAPGSYSIQPYAGAYVISGERNFFGARKTVTLKAGETAADVDFTLTRGGVITGRVTDADGKPVIAERLNLARVVERSGDQRIFNINFLTDDRGVYRIYGLEAGRYVISAGQGKDAQVFGGSRFFYPQTFYPNVTARQEATLVEVTEGGIASDIDIRLSPPVETFTATGRVVDAETGQPVEGAKLAFGRLNNGRAGGFGSDNRPTDKNGGFLLEGLTAGEYILFLWTFNTTSPNYSETLKFTVNDADITGLEVKQRRGSTVSGTIRLENGGALDGGARWPALNLAPTQRKDDEPFHNVEATPAPNGAFTFIGARPGRVRVNLDYNAGEQGFTLLRVEHNGLDVTKDGVEIAPGQDLNGLQAVVEYGACALIGQIAYTNGRPAENARVTLLLRRRDWPATVIPRRAQLDTRGSFVIKNLSPGAYTALLSVDGPNAPRRIKPQTVTVACTDAPATITFDLTPAGGPQ